MIVSTRLISAALVAALAACGTEQPQPDAVAIDEPTEESAPAERFAPDAISTAKGNIKAEAKVVDFVYDPENVVEWVIAVKDDGTSRHGYAQYICQLLRDANAYDDEVEVRIVDAAKIAEFKDAYREYSLGTVRCQNGDHLD
jgi:hypothetical protein